ncbi:MAG: DUF5677 domain-containing protein [Pseudomonadota bacterium]
MGKKRRKLDAFKRKGKALKHPYSILGEDNLHFSAWVDDGLANLIWAALIASQLNRDEYLQIFRDVLIRVRERSESYKSFYVTHSALAQQNKETFETAFGPVFASEIYKRALSPLALLYSLPDKHHWSRFLRPPVDRDAAYAQLGKAVIGVFDHQSEKATDLRWLCVASRCISEKMVLGTDRAEEFSEQIRRYPDYGDMRSVRPMIRATEMAFRNPALHDEDDPQFKLEWQRSFWKQVYEETQCLPLPHAENTTRFSRELVQDIQEAYYGVAEHFYKKTEDTELNPKKDTVFGIVLYVLYLAALTEMGGSGKRPECRIFLRIACELFITLKFLTIQNQEKLWIQYRNYGSGKATLAFLKIVDAETLPEYVDIDDLERLANEDAWYEMRDIKLGHWASVDLRKMSEQIGEKDTYDKYYDWTSSFAHGNWGAIRDTHFTLCANPLHRFHRIPTHPNHGLPSATNDIISIVNRCLDLLNQHYPPFKRRIKKPIKPTGA